MLISFARHYDNNGGQRGADRYLPLTSYLDAPVVMKAIGPQREPVLRDPRPEILVGRGDRLRQQLSILPFQRKYTSLVLSFAPRDVDVARFNAGDPLLRGQVDLTLQLVFQLAWAGIPQIARPPVYVTTHTHTSRLEVNLVIPRAVFRSDGRIMSHNPHPPGDAGRSRQDWSALQDIVNHRFGWADPCDPARRRLVAPPTLFSKRAAELERAGLDPAADPQLRLTDTLITALVAGTVRTNREALDLLAPLLANEGMAILSKARGILTMGVPGALSSEHLRLRGRLFSDGFVLRDPSPAEHAERAAELAAAPARFMAGWNRRLAYNQDRYGQGTWPRPDWDLALWFADDPLTARRLIPARHHLVPSTPRLLENAYADSQPRFDRPPYPRRAGADRAAAGDGDRVARVTPPRSGTEEQRIGKADRQSGSKGRGPAAGAGRFVRVARTLSGPAGLAARLNQLAAWLAPVASRLAPLRATAQLAAALTAPVLDRLDRLDRLATDLESLNVDRTQDLGGAVPRPDAGHAPSAADADHYSDDAAEHRPGSRQADRPNDGGDGADRDRAGGHDHTVRNARIPDGGAGENLGGFVGSGAGSEAASRPGEPRARPAGRPDPGTPRSAAGVERLPRRIDLLRAGQALLEQLGSTEARLRVIPSGFSYVSAGLRLDLSRYGIILRQAAPMPTRAQRRLVRTLEAIGRDLGFEPDSDSIDLLPPLGGAIAVHPVVKTWDAALMDMATTPVSEEPGVQEAVDPAYGDAATGMPDTTDDDAVTDTLCPR
ncbi:hypothetical protein [Paracoccus benzoatiresistens]|uniref:Relaxase/mobilization nuclease-like protein n=1 Tax=Paracoccus benzoatiresistens TaxID=2997341 RepID=A0ABT4J5I9_9RHOB|nr:hypothetical protein [Paracoccus sp. EF6]MCZ0962391.1 hypothetical protein [Paracoccus sp. EF6]